MTNYLIQIRRWCVEEGAGEEGADGKGELSADLLYVSFGSVRQRGSNSGVVLGRCPTNLPVPERKLVCGL